MEYNITKCDQCEKQIAEFAPKGWINIKRANFYGRRWKEILKSHFCSFTCFQDYCLGTKAKAEEEVAQD